MDYREDRQYLEDQEELSRPQPKIRITPQKFLPLIIEVMARGNIKSSDLVKRTGISKSKICRLLSEQRQIDNAALYLIFDALGIDPMRALLAVGRFGQWEQYFDLDVEIIADLIDVLPSFLSKARSESIRTSISRPGAIVLAERLSEMIAKNDRETEKRQLERPIAGM